MTEPTGTAETTQNAISITRIFDAPRDLVFKAWIEPEHVTHWWGPHHFTTPLSTIEIDPRPGGVYHLTMVENESGAEHPVRGVIREIVEPERLVIDCSCEDNPDVTDHESVVTVTFGDLGDKTELTFHQDGLKEGLSYYAGMGWTQQFERFDAYLAQR